MKLIDRYHTLVFDLDGTLTNTGLVWLDIFRDGLADCGITGLSDHAIAEHTHNWPEVLKLGVPAERLEDFIQGSHRRAHERLALAPLHEGARDMLAAAQSAGKRIGIYSTMDRPVFEPVIAQHRLDQYATVTIAGSDVERRKPDPEGIHTALGKLGVLQSEYKGVAYIGDKGTDVQAAENAGVDGILFFPPAHQTLYDYNALMQSRPTAVITGWRELYT